MVRTARNFPHIIIYIYTSGNVEHFWRAGAIRKDVVCIIAFIVIKIFVQNQGYIVTKAHWWRILCGRLRLVTTGSCNNPILGGGGCERVTAK